MAEKNLVKELEGSLQTCITTLLSEDRSGNELPNKIGIESSIERFLESARNLEGYFAKFQMYNSINHPQDTIREDIIKLKEELSRKEVLLNTVRDKTSHWNNKLNNLIKRQNDMSIVKERNV